MLGVMQLEKTSAALEQLRIGGLLTGSTSAALAAAVKGLAEAVDNEPSNAALWRAFLQAWKELRVEVNGRVDESADKLDRLLQHLGEA